MKDSVIEEVEDLDKSEKTESEQRISDVEEDDGVSSTASHKKASIMKKLRDRIYKTIRPIAGIEKKKDRNNYKGFNQSYSLSGFEIN